MQEKELLRKLCTSHGPSGREHWIYPIIKDAFEPFCDEVRQGNLNNAYAIKKGNGKASIMLMAHADEVFMQVDKICENGFVKFTTLGIDVKTLVSQEVLIHGKEKRSEEHTSELQSRQYLVCRLLLEKKKNDINRNLIST